MYERIAISENCNECCGLLLHLFPCLNMPRGNLNNHHWHQGVYSLLVPEQIQINQNSGYADHYHSHSFSGVLLKVFCII